MAAEDWCFNTSRFTCWRARWRIWCCWIQYEAIFVKRDSRKCDSIYVDVSGTLVRTEALRHTSVRVFHFSTSRLETSSLSECGVQDPRPRAHVPDPLRTQGSGPRSQRPRPRTQGLSKQVIHHSRYPSTSRTKDPSGNLVCSLKHDAVS